jgi:transposase
MVYKWMDRFDTEGPSGLYDREREGRPRKVDEEADQELDRVLQAGPPPEEGYERARWTAPTLAEHLERTTGTDVHPKTVREALERLGYSWKRPRRRLPDDPNYEERMVAIEQAIAEVDAETSILFEDETELKRFPPLRKGWMPQGEQREVAVPESNEKFALYGALDARTGQVVVESHPKGRSDYTKSFLGKVIDQVNGEILLIWDRASWHTSGKVEEWIDEHDRLEVLLLPKRSPEDNPVEDLWRELKNVIAANLERGLEALKAACRRFFDALSPQEALRTAGLASS